MKTLKKLLISIMSIAVGMMLLIIGLLYFFQEKLIFFPTKLTKNYEFQFHQKFEEISLPTNDNLNLHGILFKADSSKGLIFYLHGNGGALDSWGEIAEVYTDLQYDLFILDYRGYGKSEGKILNQEQFYQDVQLAYNHFKQLYKEEKIIVLGYSIGTAAAAKLASENRPKRLILQAPYYSLTYLMRSMYPIVPTFVLKYKFETFQYVKNTKVPITIFHGDQDRVISISSSLKLKGLLKPTDELIILEEEGHNGMSGNRAYLNRMKVLLEN